MFDHNFLSRTLFFGIFIKIWASYSQTDLKIRSPMKFCSRYAFSEVCTSKKVACGFFFIFFRLSSENVPSKRWENSKAIFWRIEPIVLGFVRFFFGLEGISGRSAQFAQKWHVVFFRLFSSRGVQQRFAVESSNK